MDRTNLRRTILICLLLGAATLAAYWPALHNDFTLYDDPDYVTENAHVLSGLSWEGVGWAFRTGFASNWHPLTWLSHMLDIQLFGLQPQWHHLTSVLFHIANSLLLFAVLKRMTGALWRSAAVAALFALHPLHVESVAWISERKDVLSTFFFLLTLLAYARYVGARVHSPQSAVHSPPPSDQRSRFTFYVLRFTKHPSFYYALSLLFLALGLMSKAMLVTTPFVLLLLDYWPLQRFEIENQKSKIKNLLPFVWEKLPFFALVAASSITTFLVQDTSHATSLGLPLWPRVANAIASYLKYLGKTFWPAGLSAFYPHPDLRWPVSNQWPATGIFGAATVLLVISGLAVIWLKRRRWFAVGWFWFLGTLVPVIGIVQVGGQAIADRYTYIPLIGIFICVVWGAAEAFAHVGDDVRRLHSVDTKKSESPYVVSYRKWVLAGFGLLVLGLCAGLTRIQATYWHDDVTLFRHALTVDPNNPIAHHSVGNELAKAGKPELALPHFRAAIEADPTYAEAYCTLAATLAVLGKPDEGIAACQTALRYRPWHAVTHTALGVILSSQGKRQEALDQYNEALRLNPECTEAHYCLGALLLDDNKVAEADLHLRQAARRKPKDLGTQLALGRLLAVEGKLPEAESQFRQVEKLCPTNAQVQLYLGSVLLGTGHTNEAATAFSTALRLDPNLPDETIKEGKAFVARGQLVAAQGRFGIVARIKPDNADAHENLGLLYAQQGKLPEAVAEFEQTLRLRPDAQAWYDLGLARVMQGDLKSAVTNYEQAVRLKPDWAVALNDLAWILATAPQADLRNGAEAVRLAERARDSSGGKEAQFWGTLDAAYAEAGRFDEAIRAAQKTQELANQAGDKEIVQAAEQRLALYRAGKPYRQKPVD